ncbi:MAG: uroporphyrinogen decarboxylase [Proteobacteria bacterium]|nr:uroporphyrinogen decarboxylase [Pseudomonadota bacterium]
MSAPTQDHPTQDRPKTLLRALGGEAVWPPPMWLMRQAGRYLPEYRAVRSRAGDFIALCTAPELAAEVTLQPIRRYGMDGAILFSDILMLPWALGHGLRFAEGEGPVLPRLEDQTAIDRLDRDRLHGAIAPILETVRRVRQGLRDEGLEGTALIGFAGAPFTVACYMVEGGGSKEFARVRAMAYGQPALFGRLMDVLTEATIDYLAAQAAAGAEALMLFDSWAGVLSPSLFRRHVIAPSARIAAALKARFPDLKMIGFPRLAGMMLGAYAAETGVDAVGMDTATDPVLAARAVPARMAVQGNLDPMALLAGGEALRAEASGILAALRGRPFVFNLGHGIVPQTPPEHVAALVRQVRDA